MDRIPVAQNSILLGDCLEVLQCFPPNVFSAILTDPPYGLGSNPPDMREVLRGWLDGRDIRANNNDFMGRDWQLPGPKIWKEVMRVLKPGGHILSFSGSRTYDMMVTAMRLAGSEIRDQINVHCEIEPARDWTYGSGFPKSLNIEKALEKEIIDAIESQGIEFTGWEEERQ